MAKIGVKSYEEFSRPYSYFRGSVLHSLLSILSSNTKQVLTMSSNSPNYVMKSNVGDGFDERGPCQTELNSNFADLKPSRPSFYKKEFKKCRESLQMNGEVKWNNISNEISNK